MICQESLLFCWRYWWKIPVPLLWNPVKKGHLFILQSNIIVLLAKFRPDVIYYSVRISERPSILPIEMYGSLISIDCGLFRQSPSVSIAFLYYMGRSVIADATFYYRPDHLTTASRDNTHICRWWRPPVSKKQVISFHLQCTQLNETIIFSQHVQISTIFWVWDYCRHVSSIFVTIIRFNIVSLHKIARSWF